MVIEDTGTGHKLYQIGKLVVPASVINIVQRTSHDVKLPFHVNILSLLSVY